MSELFDLNKTKLVRSINVIQGSYRKNNEINQKLYRYDITLATNEYSESYIWLTEYNVIRFTRCNYVICTGSKDKFVLKDARKRFAYPTKELAWKSFKIRCDWRLRYANRDLRLAELALQTIKEYENDIAT